MSGNSNSLDAPFPKKEIFRRFTQQQLEELGPLTFGFDIGIASVGWAVLSEKRIVDLGVRCFDAAEDHKKKISLNQARRVARVSRNRYAQRRSRLKRLRALFVDLGLLDNAQCEKLFGKDQPRGSVPLDAWKLRSEALSRILAPEELASVLYQQVKWRGYGSLREAKDRAVADGLDQSNLESVPESKHMDVAPSVAPQQTKQKKFSAALDDSSALIAPLLKKFHTIGNIVCRVTARDFNPTSIDEKNARKLYLSARRNHNDGYERSYLRKYLREEIIVLLQAQRDLGNPIIDSVVPESGTAMQCVQVGAGVPRPLTRSFEDQVLALFDEQYPPIVAAHMEQLVGKCELEEKENRAPKESFSSERSRWLQTLNRLKVHVASECKGARFLEKNEHEALVSLPYDHVDVNYETLRNALCENAKTGWPRDWRLASFDPLSYKSVAQAGSDQINVIQADGSSVTLAKYVVDRHAKTDKKARKLAGDAFRTWLSQQMATGDVSLRAIRDHLSLPTSCTFRVKKNSLDVVLPDAEEKFPVVLTGIAANPFPTGYSIKIRVLSSAKTEALPPHAMHLLQQWSAAQDKRTLLDLRSSVATDAWPKQKWQFVVEAKAPAQEVLLESEHRFVVEITYTDAQEIEKDTKVIRLSGWHKLRRAVENTESETWINMQAAYAKPLSDDGRVTSKLIDDIFVALTMNFTDREIKDALHAISPPLPPTVVKALLNVVSSGFGHLSFLALRTIQPKLEERLVYSDACKHSSKGYDHSGARSKRTAKKLLDPLDSFQFRRISVKTGRVKQKAVSDGRLIEVCEKRYKELSNPVVARSFNQARNVLNALIEIYGSPAFVGVELARDMSKPGEVRKKIDGENKERAKRKEGDLDKFKQDYPGLREYSTKLMRKVRMREEQCGKCIYSGKEIRLHDLLKDENYVQVDHPLPQSRFSDFSLDNQVLVLSGENLRKGNLTPFEWHGKDNREWWHSFKVIVNSLPLMSAKKKAKLLDEAPDEKEFVGRNMVDTQYATRLFARLLREGLLFRDGMRAEESNLSIDSTGQQRYDNLMRARVRTPQGGAVAMLRGLWGLSKNREASDLHHAIDACVVAAASPKLIQRLNEYHRYEEMVIITPNGTAVWRGRDPQDIKGEGEVLSADELASFTETEFPDPFAPHRFHQEVMARISENGRRYRTKSGSEWDYDFKNYADEERDAVRSITVSRAVQRRSGEVHEQSIWSYSKGQEPSLEKYVFLKDLTDDQLKDAVGRDDPRNAWLFDAIRKRLAANNGNYTRAFAEPILKPSSNPEQQPIIRRVKVRKGVVPGLGVRGGHAAIGKMTGYQLFLEGKRFALYPDYAAPREHQKQVSRPDQVATHLGALRRNDFLEITWQAKKQQVCGYLHMYESGGEVTLRRHDQPQVNHKIPQFHFFRRSIATASSIQVIRVDVLGKRYRGPKYTNELA